MLNCRSDHKKIFFSPPLLLEFFVRENSTSFYLYSVTEKRHHSIRHFVKKN